MSTFLFPIISIFLFVELGDVVDDDGEISLAGFDAFLQLLDFLFELHVVLIFKFYLIGQILYDLFAFLV